MSDNSGMLDNSPEYSSILTRVSKPKPTGPAIGKNQFTEPESQFTEPVSQFTEPVSLYPTGGDYSRPWLAAEKAEKDRAAAEKAERKRLAKEERVAAEKAAEVEKAKNDRAAAEKRQHLASLTAKMLEELDGMSNPSGGDEAEMVAAEEAAGKAEEVENKNEQKTAADIMAEWQSMARAFPIKIRIDGVQLELRGSIFSKHYASVIYNTQEEFDSDLEKVQLKLGTGDHIKTFDGSRGKPPVKKWSFFIDVDEMLKNSTTLSKFKEAMQKVAGGGKRRRRTKRKKSMRKNKSTKKRRTKSSKRKSRRRR